VQDRIREFEVTEEIKHLGFSRIRVIGKTLLVYNTSTKPIHCKYDRDDLSRTMNWLRKALDNSGEFEHETIEKFIVLLSQVWLNSEAVNGEAEGEKSEYEKARTAQIGAIKTEIDRVKNQNDRITSQAWSIGLVARYNDALVISVLK
jgi:hypothetical protein